MTDHVVERLFEGSLAGAVSHLLRARSAARNSTNLNASSAPPNGGFNETRPRVLGPDTDRARPRNGSRGGPGSMVSPRLATASHRRLLWLGALTSMLLVLVGEASGVAHSVSRLATIARPLPGHGVIVTTTDTALEAAWDSVDAAPGITLPSADTTRRTPATGAWWPGLAWLAGTLGLLAYRVAGHTGVLHRDRRPDSRSNRNSANKRMDLRNGCVFGR